MMARRWARSLLVLAVAGLFTFTAAPGTGRAGAMAVAAAQAAAPVDVELLRDPLAAASWTHENHAGAISTFTGDGTTLKLSITTPGGQPWHVQMYQAGKPLVPGAKYTLTFEARSTVPRPLSIAAIKDVPEYDSVGLFETIQLAPAWKTFEFTFTATNEPGDTARLPAFQAGATVGVIELRKLSVRGPSATTEAPIVALPDRFVPFVIPWDDAKSGVATDLSAMNRVGKPLPRIEVVGGHFTEAGTGKRVRFWATNFGAGEAFPDKASADAVAARLAKYGVNLVRLHHLDNPWAIASQGSIWDRTQQKKVIDPAQLDKLHYLVAALARNGIYINFNLKVSKQLSAADGAPDGTDALSSSMTMNYQKKVDRFVRFFIDHQKAFARQILTAPNPYRDNQPMATDPAVAFLEINNENAAAGWPGEEPGAGLTQLPPVFREDLRNQWVRFLRQKYTNQTKLLAAWKNDADKPGKTLLTSAARWSPNMPGDSQLDLQPGPADNAAATDKAPPTDGPPEAQFVVQRTSGTEWHAQGILEIPTPQTDKIHTLEFDAQASPPRSLRVSIDRNGAPWDNQGLNGTVPLTEQWTTQRLVFRAGDAAAQRMALQLGAVTGRVGIRNVKLYPGVGGEPLAAGESLDTGNVSLPTGAALPNVQADWRLFITDVDRRFAEEMFDFLQKDLGAKGLTADTQIQWGGTGGLAREARLQWTDSHSYWNHPTFSNGDWNPRSWTVRQASLTDAFSRGDFATLGDLATHRVAGKPFSVSEYDHPAPNDFASEMMPMTSSWGALQDWDKIYTFSYAQYGPNVPTDRITGFFDQSSNPAKWAFNPSAALIFREGLISPLASTVTLSVPADLHRDVWATSTAWRLGGGVPDLFTTRVAISRRAPGDDRTITQSKVPGKPGDNAVMTKGPHGAIYLARSARAVVATGFLGGAAIDALPFKLAVDEFGNQFASMTLVPLDGQPLATSKRMLLTILGRAENPGMGWNADRTSVSDRWGTGPVHIEAISADLTLPTGRTLAVHPLPPTDERKPPLDATNNKVRLSPASGTAWYEITAP